MHLPDSWWYAAPTPSASSQTTPSLKQASSANRFVLEQRIDPCMSEVFAWENIPLAHMKMWKNQHPPGNMAVMVNAPREGLKTLEDAIEAAGG